MSSPVTVVVVDDRAMFRSGVRAELASYPSRVTVLAEAEDVDTAVEQVRSHRPDVVLLDVHLPGGGGVEVMRRVAPRMPDTKFLALSVSDSAEDVIGAAEGRFNRVQCDGANYKERHGVRECGSAGVLTSARAPRCRAWRGRSSTRLRSSLKLDKHSQTTLMRLLSSLDRTLTNSLATGIRVAALTERTSSSWSPRPLITHSKTPSINEASWNKRSVRTATKYRIPIMPP